MKKDFYANFIRICNQRGEKPTKVAEAAGLSKSAATYWRNGSEPTDANISKIAEYFGISTAELIGRSDPDAVRIPVLGSVPAGVPLEAIEDITDWEEIPISMTAGGKEFFALKVKGDSMWYRFVEGDTVIVRKTPTCKSGDICVVFVNGYDATLKEVRIDEVTKSLSLIPANPNYPPRTFTAEEVRQLPVTIAGVVVELRRKI